MKKKKGTKRSAGSFKETQVRSDKIAAYKYDSKPSTLMSTSVQKEGLADRELRRLVKADVFRSSSKSVKETNSNPRRYQ